MNRIYSVKISHYKVTLTPHYEVVAASPVLAIAKARRQARRDTGHISNWVLEELIHRGKAV